MAKRRQKLQLKIVLDTNAIWTGGESYLLRREMSELVNTNRGDAHLEIEWGLPEMVVRERVYQMQLEAAALLPSLARLERVIGHPLNITEKIIGDRISDAVDSQIREHQLVIHPASYDQIDWLRLVGDAVNRRPPFEGKGEKGFRDAIIAETFLQLVKKSPEQSTRCRIVLLTTDALLSQAIKIRVSERNNVQIFSSADELKGLINTLMSTVPEEYVAQLQTKAKEYFLKDEKSKTGLVYDMKVQDAVRLQCAEQLGAKPEGTNRRSNGIWHVTPPRFVKKEGQRVFWASRFSIEASAYKTIPQEQYENITPGMLWTTAKSLSSPETNFVDINQGVNMAIGAYGAEWGKPGLVKLNTLLGNESLSARGKTTIDVHWSVSVNVKRVFSKPTIDSIQFVETTWENIM